MSRMVLFGRLFASLLLLALICAACAPAPEIVIDWDDLTYEDVRSFENVTLASYRGGKVTLSDLMPYIDREFTPANKEELREILMVSLFDPSYRLDDRWIGWDGPPSVLAEGMAANGVAAVDAELASLSADPEEARRLYALKNWVDSEYVKQSIRRFTALNCHIFYDENFPAEEAIADYEEKKEEEYFLLAGLRIPYRDIDAEEVLRYLQDGNNLFTYGYPGYASPDLNQAGLSFYVRAYYYPHEGEVWEWAQSAQIGDAIYLEDERKVVQYWGNTAEEVRLVAINYYNFKKIARSLVRTGPSELWEINDDVIDRIVIRG